MTKSAHRHQDLYKNQTRIEELDGIRGIAAFLIVIYHIPIWNSAYNLTFIRNFYLMVNIFFVLSGFLIYKTYSNKLKNIKEFSRFLFLRFGRLYPLHIFFLTVFVVIEIIKYFAQNNFGIISLNSQPFRENNITALFQNIFLVQAIGPTNNAITFNLPSWTVSVEFYTYFLFALIVLYLKKFKIFLFFGFFIVSLSFLLISKNYYGFDLLLNCLSGFFLGSITAFLENKIKVTLPKYTSLVAFIMIVLFLIFKINSSYDPIIFFLTTSLILTLTANKNGYLNKRLKLRLFVWLGSISYSLYMSHFCIIWIVNQFIRVVLKKPEILIAGKSIPQLTNFESFIAVILILTTVLIVSTLVHKFIETPFRLKSRLYGFSNIK
jgi:peptidoglycan/LPS O-acetylase OafA/YrhL